MTRLLVCMLATTVVVWFVLVVRGAEATPPVSDDGSQAASAPPAQPAMVLPAPAHDLKVATLKRELAVEHHRLRVARQRVHVLTRTLAHHSSTREAIELACSVYGSCGTLWRRALCESHGNPSARNPSGAAGLFQFQPGTFRSTPFADFSIWSPYANALAAGWMEANGRGGEWACR